ncbi:hypothetical protein L1987_84577 [Smallanthus sonchifolius]|uniref:Uncharacterized protein n=1 Tax=Smallanthus sonchifolius TaxID=185202 RepID=A0ACB8XU11_9ASTR|nr:hypothetical protein L1987_84577 [Smallanthus sonchifolius]
MPRKKEPPPSALPSRRSTRANNRVAEDSADLEPLVVPMAGLGSNLEAVVRVSQPPPMEITSEMNKVSRPILSDARSGMPSIQDVNIEKDECRENKEQSTIPGSNASSECSSTSVKDMDSTADKVGLSTPIASAGKTVSTGLIGNMDTTGKTVSAGNIGLAVLERNPWKCGVFGHNEDVHNPPPPPPVVESMAMDPPKMAPPVATNKGKEKLDDGFIKWVKKKKRFNGPKPRVQVPSLNVSKPGPSKPTGRARPNVLVSNPFSALDDTTQIEDCFPE